MLPTDPRFKIRSNHRLAKRMQLDAKYAAKLGGLSKKAHSTFPFSSDEESLPLRLQRAAPDAQDPLGLGRPQPGRTAGRR